MQKLLEIKNLTVEYQSSSIFKDEQTVRAVNNISFSVNKGEIFSIAGESGCGKSTLSKAIMRLVPTKSGEIIFYPDDSQPVNILAVPNRLLNDFRPKVQMIFQNPYSSLNPKMKIYDTLKEPLILHKRDLSKSDADKLIFNVLSQVGLDKSSLDLYPHEFSGGQRQRIAIARALILNPMLLLADEPVSALDVSIQAQIINLLKDLRDKLDLTMIFISHDLNVIKYLSDRVAIMYLGEIVEIGTSDEIFLSPRHPYTKALLSANPGNEKKKSLLKGDLPSPANPPQGCKFHTRCPSVMNVCSQLSPDIINFSDTHCCTCHLYAEEHVR